MPTDTNPASEDQEQSVEFGCWKWIFLSLIVIGAIAIGYLMLV